MAIYNIIIKAKEGGVKIINSRGEEITQQGSLGEYAQHQVKALIREIASLKKIIELQDQLINSLKKEKQNP